MEPEVPPPAPPPRRRRRLAVLAAATLGLLGLDLLQPPERQASTFVLLAAIDGYQATLSKVARASGVRCRFHPTCSHYGEAAIRKYGALEGSARAAFRVMRCGPWTPAGTEDPP